MPSNKKILCILALVLGVTFLAAQLHYCVDLSSEASSTHFCPICSATGHAITTTSPDVAATPTVYQLELSSSEKSAIATNFREVAPRGPPCIS
jgi:hypothetical protein